MDGSIKGIGGDIVSVSRIAVLLGNTRFLDKVCTEYEQNYLCGKGAQTAAGIWAAKEAVSKALGTGCAGFGLHDIEVRHDENGAPRIVLHHGAKARAELIGATSVHVSISHETEQALAFAAIE